MLPFRLCHCLHMVRHLMSKLEPEIWWNQDNMTWPVKPGKSRAMICCAKRIFGKGHHSPSKVHLLEPNLECRTVCCWKNWGSWIQKPTHPDFVISKRLLFTFFLSVMTIVLTPKMEVWSFSQWILHCVNQTSRGSSRTKKTKTGSLTFPLNPGCWIGDPLVFF